MHHLSSSFVLGYHGCDRDVADRLLDGEPFRPSSNDFDWLGSGIYFWEANPLRGLEFARELQERRRRTPSPLRDPCVIGAIIDLGLCLDLLSSTGNAALVAVYESFVDLVRKSGTLLPRNRHGADLLLRNLDCAIINHFHALLKEGGQPAFDTVRGVFVEGEPIYPGAGFRSKTHIQICVRNLGCIKGVFRVPPEHLEPGA
jgi:hypothetical protein